MVILLKIDPLNYIDLNPAPGSIQSCLDFSLGGPVEGTTTALPETLLRRERHRGDDLAFRFLADGTGDTATDWTYRDLAAHTAAVAAALDGMRGRRVVLAVHHAYTDTDRDPHSPRPIGGGRLARLRGLWHGHVGWLFTVRRDNWSRHVRDLLADRTVMRINELYFVWVALGLALPAALGGLLTGSLAGAVSGLLWGGPARIFLLDQVTWGVNSIGHTLGSRPYATRDNSRNVALMAPVSVGGSWHNNHHARPAAALNRHGFWQIDVTGTFIRFLDRLGIVHDVRYIPSSPGRRSGAREPAGRAE